jgi:glycosidase
MLWGDKDTVKNPIGSTYKESNQIDSSVKEQKRDKNSLYNYYCKLIAIRHKHPEIARGEYDSISCGNKNLGGFLVEYNGECLVIIHNTSSGELTYDLTRCAALNGKGISELCDCIGGGKAFINGSIITVPAYSTVILK